MKMEFKRLIETIKANTGGLQDVLISIGIILAAIVLGLIVQRVLSFFLSRWRKSHLSAEMQADLKPENWRGPLRALLPALLLMPALPLLQFPSGVIAVMRQAIWIWIIASIAWLTISMLSVIKNFILRRYRIDAKDNLQARRMYTQLGVIERILKVLIIFLALTFILLTFERVRQIGFSLLASAGILSIILGFSAQKSLATLFAGIQIALTQPIRLDDVVIVENEWGWIEEITLTYVVVKIWDQRRLVVPISYFIEKPFQNWTRTTAEMLGTVYLYADYTLPVQEIREELQRILENTPLWDQRVGVLQVTGANERTLELRALMSAEDSPTAWSLRCHVREKLVEFMQRNFPQNLPQVRIEVAEAWKAT
ncbi:MAG: mechanosensitive ion channel [Desulfobacterales bacterium]|nr:MAG: mechanosensitive ion channel [Desulfobacterales bacterium]